MGELSARFEVRQRRARDIFTKRHEKYLGQRAAPTSTGCSRHEDHRELQPQGWRRQDHRRGQPRLPVRAAGSTDPAVGPRSAGRRHLSVPDQPARQGWKSAARRGARGRSSTPSKRPTSTASTCCRPTSPIGTWTSTSTADPSHSRPCADCWPRSANEFDVVILDTPPSLSLVSENVLRASDVVLVPLIPTVLSVRTFDQLSAFVADLKGAKPVLRGYFSMLDRRRKLHLEILTSLPAERSPDERDRHPLGQRGRTDGRAPFTGRRVRSAQPGGVGVQGTRGLK